MRSGSTAVGIDRRGPWERMNAEDSSSCTGGMRGIT
eukprot:CAMPEP_0172202352 /NCGR_PEP_ID=MMETSP1050-20130122/30588_1 /TAXON_ID=233186 /ORGANISM="Cryptomonas curvata, Strain CCAP979/52" /LENGTH=35 /DNA_ID= /DNA_START= /DNA_END= /DNA_ORIENTATION=